MILVHRLLKNTVIENGGPTSYGFFTDPCATCGSGQLPLPAHSESYEGFGEVTGVVQDQEAKIATKEGTIDDLLAKVGEKNKHIENAVAEITGLTKSNQEKDAQVSQMTFDLDEIKKERLQLVEEKDYLEGVLSDLANAGISIERTDVPAVKGRVVRVDRELGVVVINKGAGSDVKPNINFTVYNDDGYVGTVLVHAVDVDVSLGRISLAAGKKVRVGDMATTTIRP